MENLNVETESKSLRQMGTSNGKVFSQIQNLGIHESDNPTLIGSSVHGCLDSFISNIMVRINNFVKNSYEKR